MNENEKVSVSKLNRILKYYATWSLFQIGQLKSQTTGRTQTFHRKHFQFSSLKLRFKTQVSLSYKKICNFKTKLQAGQVNFCNCSVIF